MEYKNIVKGEFISRPNRFIANVKINNEDSIAHVKNTGRCKELLTPNATIFLQEFDNETRKTKYDLISVYKGDRLINMDSQAPNKIFYEWVSKSKLFKQISFIKPECTYESSRFDFYIEADDRKIFVEVKGVTLEDNGVVRFPDAPTLRGLKHINELIDAKKHGYDAYIVFIVQMNNVKHFSPNDETHKEFGEVLRLAKKKGVKILAFDCIVSKDSISINKKVNIVL